MIHLKFQSAILSINHQCIKGLVGGVSKMLPFCIKTCSPTFYILHPLLWVFL
jgi:hypothetical protein